jgi:hypothetical protein
LPIPHPENFLKRHADVVNDRGYDLCWRCHIKSTCTPCHVMATHPSTAKSKFKFN